MAYKIVVSDPEEPIRAELFSVERLEQHAESLAKAQRVAPGIRHRKPLPKRLRENGRAFNEAYREIAAAAKAKRPITPAGEWLLDNYHVVEAQIREVRNDLPADFYRKLPKLAEGYLAGYPRVYGIAWALVAHTDSAFDLDRLTRFINAYQRIDPLKIGELWAIAITLRLTLIENLRRLAVNTASRSRETDRADGLVERILDNEPIERITGELERKPLRGSVIVRLEQRLRDQGPEASQFLRWLEDRITADGQTTEQVIQEEFHHQAAANVTVGNVITSMRLISDIDWTEFFESVSLVDQTLASGTNFKAMEFSTRDRYRRAVEKLANGSRLTEIEVAVATIEQTERASRAGRPPRQRDPGYYLIARGRRDLERIIDFRPGLADRIRRGFAATGLGGYLSAVALLTLAIVALVGWAVSGAHAVSPYFYLVVLVLGLIPASDLALAAVNRILTDRWGPACLPGMALRDGVPADCTTLLA
ncbi:MAG: glycosyl transferase, partial [Alphaproteobacteria bacterium]|nr:glycosyl transferase [Alphaproteobacteria bacterium]